MKRGTILLTFEEKIKIIETFPELMRKDVSLGRVNFHFKDSLHDKSLVVQYLHPNGNGFVYAGFMKRRTTDRKGFMNIRDYSEEELREILAASIAYLSKPFDESTAEDEEDEFSDLEGVWTNRRSAQELTLVREDLLWNVYSGENLEECFESPIEAERYLVEEGFRRKRR